MKWRAFSEKTKINLIWNNDNLKNSTLSGICGFNLERDFVGKHGNVSSLTFAHQQGSQAEGRAYVSSILLKALCQQAGFSLLQKKVGVCCWQVYGRYKNKAAGQSHFLSGFFFFFFSPSTALMKQLGTLTFIFNYVDQGVDKQVWKVEFLQIRATACQLS